MKKYTTEDFIKKAKEVHGDKYDYSKTIYVNSKQNVIITCPIHGDFVIRASHHLYGIGCHKCAKEAADKNHTSTTDIFIEKAKAIHGEKYDYSLVKYINNKTPVIIRCLTHGEFLQKPSDHLLGCNCPKCAFLSIGEKRKLRKEDFIEKAREVHGDRYDYSEAEYKGYNSKLKIICRKHGVFFQTPVGHISNREGCPICGMDSQKNSRRGTLETFINKANKIHKNKYDYSLTNYVNCYSKVKIICKKHGMFEQTPKNHLNGAGCPKCNISKLEAKTMSYLQDKGIEYEYEKRFPKWLGMQSLDFYLPKYKAAIECQGEQHFFPIKRAGKSMEYSERLFKKQQDRDNIKKNACDNNGVRLFYLNFNDDIIEKLSEILYLCEQNKT